jgi:hypothetical protein
MAQIKHVGKMKNNNAKVLVVFRTLPGDPYFGLVVGTASLSDSYHNAIIQLVESAQAQDANELGDILGIRHFPDGRLMLEALHSDGKLIKVGTSDVLMTPDTSNVVPLAELNSLIAEQKGLAIDELAGFIGVKPGDEVKEIAQVKEMPVQESEKAPDALDDSALAKQFRSQADAMYKEAAKLRKQADELDPPAKKATKAKETVDA